MTQRPTVCVTCVWAGVDSVWEQEKLEARKMLENAAESHTSGARCVGLFLLRQTHRLKTRTAANTPNFYTQLNLWQLLKNDLPKRRLITSQFQDFYLTLFSG
jgi:hypothetical protein